MTLFLIDTNVVSEIRKARPDPGVISWFDGVPESSIHVSVLVIGEIRAGIERLRRRDAASADVYDVWLTTLRDDYRDRIIGIDKAVAECWGTLNVPNPVAVVDGLMAATALVHRMTLVTRNVADVARTGADLVNPFDPDQR